MHSKDGPTHRSSNVYKQTWDLVWMMRLRIKRRNRCRIATHLVQQEVLWQPWHHTYRWESDIIVTDRSSSRLLSCVTGEMLQKPDESGRVSLGKCAAGRQAETRRARERESAHLLSTVSQLQTYLGGVKNTWGECFESHADRQGQRLRINRLLSE